MSTRGHVSQGVGTEQVPPTKLGVFCGTEVNEKTARPRTFSPGDMIFPMPPLPPTQGVQRLWFKPEMKAIWSDWCSVIDPRTRAPVWLRISTLGGRGSKRGKMSRAPPRQTQWRSTSFLFSLSLTSRAIRLSTCVEQACNIFYILHWILYFLP